MGCGGLQFRLGGGDVRALGRAPQGELPPAVDHVLRRLGEAVGHVPLARPAAARAAFVGGAMERDVHAGPVAPVDLDFVQVQRINVGI